MHLEGDEVYHPLPYTASRVGAYVAAAQARGLDEIGITEHGHRFQEFWPAMAPLLHPALAQPEPVVRWLRQDFRASLAAYVQAVETARAEGLAVRLGIEVDYLPGQEAAIRQALAGVAWDYVVGSVHFVDGQSIDIAPTVTWPEADVEALHRRYWEVLGQAAASGLFDVLAHPDLPKVFGRRPSRFPEEAFTTFLDVARQAGVVVEVNTAGLRKPAGEMYPAPTLLAAMVRAGLDVQWGSDAHDPRHVGWGWPEALALCRRVGVRQVVRWRGRRRTYRPLVMADHPAEDKTAEAGSGEGSS